jgi:hypothetical protein
MATTKLNEYSVDLSFKLQDPVATYNVGGQRYSSALRHKYLKDAYRFLFRHLLIFSPQTIKKVFNNLFQYRTGETDNGGKISFAQLPGNVYEIYARPSGTDAEEWGLCDWVDTENWISVKTGTNKFYVPDLNTRQYFWTIIKVANLVPAKIEILPAVKYEYNLSLRNAIVFPEHGVDPDIEDLDLKEEFADILIGVAASNAYFEFGKSDMGKAFLDKAMIELQKLSNYEKQRDDKNEISEH